MCDEHPARRSDRPAVTIEDPNDWQKRQRLREIAAAKEQYKLILNEARDARTLNHSDAEKAAQCAHGAVVDYIAELLPQIEKATVTDSVQLSHDYLYGVQLGRLNVPEPPFDIDLYPDKVGDPQTVIEVNADVGTGEFNGLMSVVNAPPTVPVEFVYEIDVVDQGIVHESIKSEYPIPLSVIQRAGRYVELFRDEVGLDLEFAAEPHRSEEPGL